MNVGRVSVFLCVVAGGVALAEPNEAVRGLLERVVGARAGGFVIETIPQDAGRDVFEIESVEGKVVLRGSNGVAVASALNWYLKHYCAASPSWLVGSRSGATAVAQENDPTVNPWLANEVAQKRDPPRDFDGGGGIALPERLPRVPEKVREVTPFRYRYCFNYCCFSYSMAWWDWPQWEQAIDWMALQGVNMPLSVTGQEGVWQAVCRDLGLTDAEIDAFFVGPAYLPFGWMGCMDGWGGPLSQTWIDRHRELQLKILERERALGMTPVLQGFTGHVPVALEGRFPDATFRRLPSWCGFPGTLFVDPLDPLFNRIGTAFVEEQTRQFGTDHLYAADTFIEMSPPSDDPAFLADMGRAVYDAMATADPEATWVMQGWVFINNPRFWQPPQAKALLGAVPDDRMILLDLHCETRPAWSRTEAFYGKPWVWCIIQSFGNQVSLHGGLLPIAEGLSAAVASPDRGRLSGIGCIMEGLGYNPVVYDLMSDLTWRPETPDLDVWIRDYAHRRYGRDVAKAARAWQTLSETAYRVPGQVGSVICARPTLTPGRKAPYDTAALGRAWKRLLDCDDKLAGVDTYRYDLVHVTRQMLCVLANRFQRDVANAYTRKDRQRLAAAGDRFLGLIRDMDDLLATRPEFLLGRWLDDAARWATTDDERRLYAWNARNQITLWGAADSVLHDYAAKQWAGLIRDFYLPRWEQFLDRLDRAITEDVSFDADGFDRDMQIWEEAWTHQDQTYPTTPQGDAVALARRFWAKYRDLLPDPVFEDTFGRFTFVEF